MRSRALNVGLEPQRRENSHSSAASALRPPALHGHPAQAVMMNGSRESPRALLPQPTATS